MLICLKKYFQGSVWVNKMIFDTHCHIYDEKYNDDFEEVLSRAKENNVNLLMLPSDNLENSFKCVNLANKYSMIYCSVGIHPSEIYHTNKDTYLSSLETLVKENCKVKAIGEIGLDYFYYKEKDEQEQQKIFFIDQIKLANKLHLPIIVHSRDACLDTLDILDKYPPLYGCVFHCFSYSKEVLNQIIKKGYYIGLDGPVTYKNALTPKEIASIVPLDKLLVETDSPYLTPTPHRGKRNEPSYIIYILQEIALLKKMTYDELCSITYQNGRTFFSI